MQAIPADNHPISGRLALLRAAQAADGRPIPAGAIGDPASGGRVVFDQGRELPQDPGSLAKVGVRGLPRDGTSFAVCYSAIVGSRAHGLEADGSDTDRRGFFIPSALLHFSLDGVPNQIVHDSDQLCYWEVGRFVRLALKANPTVLDTLFSPEVEFSLAWGERLLEIRHRFLSRLAEQTFTGYAESQFNKMQRAHERGDPVTLRHAMHLVRLLRVAAALGRTGRLDIVVPAEHRDELKAIKRGDIAWAEIARLHAHLTEECRRAFATTPLPEHPDRSAADRFLIDLRTAVARDAR